MKKTKINNINDLNNYLIYLNDLTKLNKIELENYNDPQKGYKQYDIKHNQTLYYKRIFENFLNSKLNQFFNINDIDNFLHYDFLIDLLENFNYSQNIIYFVDIASFLDYVKLSINHNCFNIDYKDFKVNINNENHIFLDYKKKLIFNLDFDLNFIEVIKKLFELNNIEFDNDIENKILYENDILTILNIYF